MQTKFITLLPQAKRLVQILGVLSQNFFFFGKIYFETRSSSSFAQDGSTCGSKRYAVISESQCHAKRLDLGALL